MKTFIKNSIISSVLTGSLLCGNVIIGQELQINDGTARYKEDDYPAVVVYMEPEPDEVKHAWRDFVKDRYDVRLRGIGFLSNRDVLYAEGTNFTQISPNRLDFYTRVVEDNDRTRMEVFASQGYDINVGLGNDYREYYNMKGIVQAFLDDYLRRYYENQVRDAEERVTKLEDAQRDKRDEIADNEKEINRLREQNDKLAQEISEAEQNWTTARDELAQRRQKLDSVLRQLASANNPVYYNNQNNNNNNNNQNK